MRNNFLQTDNLAETHRLCNFWRGYIHGFFETALPQIADLMSELSREKSLRVTLPAYHKVSSVEHLEDNRIEEDVFCVTFVKEPLSQALETLRDSRWQLKKGDYRTAMVMCQSALQSARKVLKEDFYNRLGGLDSGSLKEIFVGLMSGTLPERPDQDIANQWFVTANQVIKQLWRAGGAER